MRCSFLLFLIVSGYMSMMGEHIPQRAGGTPEGRHQGPEDSDDEVDGGQLWDAQHQVGTHSPSGLQHAS